MSKQARLGDIVNISCPHGATGIITTGSNYTYDRGKKMAKVGDTCVGSCDVGAKCCPHSRTGTIVTGSDTTYTT